MNELPRQNEIDEVFAEAIELAPEERELFLERRCQDLHPQTKEQVRSLLHADEQAGERDLFQPVINIAGSVAATDPDQGGDLVDETIGPYRLLQKIGEGGMGLVYMADQLEPVRRQVALKIIKPGMDSKLVNARFEAERQALAMMDHPNIAPVLDGGQTDQGRPYFVMELVKGTPINKYCDDRRLTLEQRLQLFLPICLAVQHAHQKGIIHRDIKPSNVLVAEYDSSPVAKVIDFGLAKALQQPLTDRTLFTQFGQVVGTFEYMSPEQAKMNQLDIDTRTDIYSLGVLLYELMTGVTPFDRQTLRQAAFDEMLRIIREVEPPRPSTRIVSGESSAEIAASRCSEPRELNRQVRGDLDAIVMKALEKERGQRYQTCSAFADDIQHYLSDEPVTATPPSNWRQLQRFVRRHRTLAIGSAVAVAGLLIAASISSFFWWQSVLHAQEKAELADKNGAQATELAEQSNRLADELTKSKTLSTNLERELLVSDIKRLCAQSFELQRSKPFVSSLLALEAVRISRQKLGAVLPTTHERLINASLQLPHPPIGGDKPEILGGHYGGFFGRRWICTRSNEHWKIYDTSKEIPLEAPLLLPRTEWLFMSADGQRIYTDDVDGKRLLRWDRESANPATLATDLDGAISSAVSVDEKWLATSYWDGTIRLRNLQSKSESALVFSNGEGADVRFKVIFSPDGRWLIGYKQGFWDDDEGGWHLPGKTVYLWDVSAPSLNSEPFKFEHEKEVLFADATKDANWLMIGREHRGVSIWDIGRNEPTQIHQLDSVSGYAGANRVTISRDKGRLAYSGAYLEVWDLKADQPERRHIFQGHLDAIKGVDMTPDGRWVVSGGSDGTVRVWDLESSVPAESVHVLRADDENARNVMISQDGRWAASDCGRSSGVRLWDLHAVQGEGAALVLNGGETQFGQIPESRAVNHVAVGADPRYMATASQDGTIKVWDLLARYPKPNQVTLAPG